MDSENPIRPSARRSESEYRDMRSATQVSSASTQYKESFAKFLTENTGLAKDGGLSADVVSGLLQDHVNQLTRALDAFLGR